MEKYTVTEVAAQLIGPIRPIGDYNADQVRFYNLQQMFRLVNDLLNEIYVVSEMAGRGEHSVAIAGCRAKEFLIDLLDMVPEEELERILHKRSKEAFDEDD